MKFKFISIAIYAILITTATFVVLSCNKKSIQISRYDDTEKLLFEDSKLNNENNATQPIIGGNVTKVTSISYNHSVLNTLKLSTEWRESLKTYAIDQNNITRTYLHNSSVSLITIPILKTTESNEYYNIYIQGDKYLITKFVESNNSNALTTYKIEAINGDLYYQFDIN